jgi:hypothetical protein
MLSVYKVVLQLNKTLSASDFPEGIVVSIQRVGDGLVHVVLNGERADAEHALRGLKESICFFQRVEIEQMGPRRPHCVITGKA